MNEETEDSREARERLESYMAKVKRAPASEILGGRMMLTYRVWPAYRAASAAPSGSEPSISPPAPNSAKTADSVSIDNPETVAEEEQEQNAAQ